MITAIIISAFLLLTNSFIKWKLRKYENPLYKFKGDYRYTIHGKNKKCNTETALFSSNSSDKSIVFLFLSGNPGNVRFYDRFLGYISDIYKRQYDVIGVGQAG